MLNNPIHPKNNTKVIVGLSGGVDSSVTALLLLQQGYEVEALFMKNWEEDDAKHCAAQQDLSDAKNVAAQLGIKLHTVNFSAEYWQEVFEDFIQEHKRGRTPNPDVLCNERIKFRFFLEYALNLGAKKIATGHYAKIIQNNGIYHLSNAKDTNKDQTYFLHKLNQYQLSMSLFPLGDMQKSKVRLIAKQYQLTTANKKDSTGICFIGEKNFRQFLAKYLPIQQGRIVDDKGRFIKYHQGVSFYTIGQRKGLEIGGGFSDYELPWFIADKNIENNELLVVQGEHPLLYHQYIIATDSHWIHQTPSFPLKCQAKIRYRQQGQDCIVEQKNDKLLIFFTQQQRAIAAGQSIVFYQNHFDNSQTICLGGSIIESRY